MNRHQTLFRRVFELPVISSLAVKIPSISYQQGNYLMHFVSPHT